MPGLVDLILEQSPGFADQEQNDGEQQPSPDAGPRLPSLYDAVTRPENASTYGNLATARVAAENETPSVGRAVAQRLPWIGDVFNFADAIQSDRSQARIASNQGTDADFSRVASAERLRQFRADMTPGENLAESLMDIPKMLVGAGVANKILGTRFAAAQGGSLANRVGNFAGQSAATAGIMGGWLSRWADNNQSQGRVAYDVRGLPPAIGHEVATMAVLGSLGRFGDAVGRNNVGGFLMRGLARVELGMAEQAGLDVATSAIQNSVQNVFDYDLGLDSGYGLVGQLARGERHEALANATQQALTFAVFAGAHEANRTPIMREYSAQMREFSRRGVPAEEAGRRMSDATSLMQAASERDLTRQEARLLLQNLPEGPSRAYAETLARTIPEQGRGSRAFLNQPMRQMSLSDLTGRGERYGSETFTDQPRRTPSLADLTKPTPRPAPEPSNPVQVLADRVGAIDAQRRAIDAQIAALPKKGGAKFKRLNADSMRLFNESQSAKAELASEMAKGSPQEGTQQPRQGIEATKPAVETPKAAKEAPAAAGKAPENAWRNTGTKFRDAADGSIEFTGRNGQPYRLAVEPGVAPSGTSAFPGQKRVQVTAFNAKGEQVGHVDFYQTKDGPWHGEGLKVVEGKDRRTGVAGAMYDAMLVAGEHVVPNEGQTDAGKKFWERNRQLGKSPTELSAAAKMMAKGREAAGTAAPVSPPVAERPIQKAPREFQEALLSARSTGDIARVLRDAPGFQNKEAMYKEFKISAEERQVLDLRFGERQMTLRAIGEKMGFSYQTAKNRESAAIEKIAGPEALSAYQEMVLKERESRSTKAGAVADSVVSAVVSGEISAERGKKPNQDLIDRVTAEREDAILELATRRNEAIAKGASKEEVKRLTDQLESLGANFNANTEREIARRFGRERKGSPSPQSSAGQTEPAPPIPGRRKRIRAGDPTSTGRAAPQTGEQNAGAERLSSQPTVEGFGKPVSEAERRAGIGGGQPNAVEVAPRQLPETAIANSAIDAWREKQGLTPILSDARRSDPAVWDAAMARLTKDPNAAARLVDTIIDSPRSTTAEENALLLQRTVAVRNERERNMMQMIDVLRTRNTTGQRTPESTAQLAELQRVETELAKEVDRADKASRLSGTEWGRAGRWRRMLVNEDYSLAGLLRRAEVAAGRPLNEAERTEIGELQAKLAEAQKKLADAEAAGKAQPGKPSDEGFAEDQARKPIIRVIDRLKETNAPWTTRAMRLAGETFNLPRSIMASIDFPLLRQGHLAMMSHPIRTIRAVPEMLRAFMSEGASERSEYEIRHGPNAARNESWGLDVTTRESGVAAREEGFLARSFGPGVIENIQKNSPALGTLLKVVTAIPRASERGYQTVMNRIRNDSLNAMASALARDGKITDAEGKVLANYVNVMTGRGPLGLTGEKAATLLNQVFFAPRWTMSRFQYIAGQPLWKNFGESAPRARRLVATEYARTLAGLGMALGLAAGFGFKVNWDSTSSAFGQMQIGNTMLDLTGGLRRPITLLSRLWSGKTTDAFGVPTQIRGPNVPHGGQTGVDLIGNYFRSSLAPVPGSAVNLAGGSDLGGRPSTVGSEIRNLGTPLFVKDVYEAMKDLGMERGTIVSLMMLMGLSTQTRTQEMRQRPPVTADRQREVRIRSQINSLRDAIRGRQNVGGRVVQGPVPSGERRAAIQSQIDRLVGQLP